MTEYLSAWSAEAAEARNRGDLADEIYWLTVIEMTLFANSIDVGIGAYIGQQGDS